MWHSLNNVLTGDGHISWTSLLFIVLLIAAMNVFDTSAYASRLAGVRTKRLSLSNTLYAMITIGSRTASALYLPSVAGIVDLANVKSFNPHYALQLLLLGSTIGTAIGIWLMPSMVNFYCLGIERMDEQGTALRVVRSLLTTRRGLRDVAHCYRAPNLSMLKQIRLRDPDVPKDLFVLNAVLYGLFLVGSICALYAGFLNPAHKSSANTLSTAINAVGAFLLLFLVDPRSAMIIDRGIARKISLDSVRNTMILLAFGRLTGTLLSQLVLFPGAHLVAWLANFYNAQ